MAKQPNLPGLSGKRKQKYWKKFPRAVSVVLYEGGVYKDWVPFEETLGNASLRSSQVHAIFFEDGRVWDCVGGWRRELHEGFEKK